MLLTVLPAQVIGTMPALFGATLATHVLCALKGGSTGALPHFAGRTRVP
jgi:hypothetical protein